MAQAPGPADAGIPAYSHQQILRVVTGIMLCILLASLDQTVIIPAVPAMAADLNAFGHLSWIVTAYLLTSTAGTPIIAKLSDSYGRRALLLPGLVLFIAASIACALVQTLPQMIVARGFQGLGGAALFSMAQASIADVVSPRERGRYQGYMVSMWGISSIAGPVLGGWATDVLSWRWIFWVNLPLGLLAMFLCDRGLRVIRTQRRPAVNIDFLGAALLVLAVVCWLLLLSWGGVEYPWTSLPILALAGLGTAAVAALAWWERLARDPILPPRLFANATFLSGVLIAFFTSLGLFGASFLLPLYFQLVAGHDAAASGFLVLPYLATNVLGAFMSGRMSRRLGRTKAIILGGLVTSLAGFALLAGLAGGASLTLLLIVSGLLGLGIGATMPSVLMQVQNAAERRDVGAATGSLLFLRSMGGAFGSTIVGAVVAARFNAGLAAAGLPPLDLGTLRAGAAAAGPALAQARAALSGGFQLAFGICAALMALAVLVAAGMKDLQLRSAADVPKDLGH